MSKLGLAISITSKLFEDTTDKGGNPYILHCLRVMEGVKHLGELAMICAVLHDVMEDSNDYSWTDIDALFGSEVVVILQLLTHRKETDYMVYIKALSVHPIAKAIKKADLIDNSNITRLKGLRQKDFNRLEKYFRAYEYLNDWPK